MAQAPTQSRNPLPGASDESRGLCPAVRPVAPTPPARRASHHGPPRGAVRHVRLCRCHRRVIQSPHGNLETRSKAGRRGHITGREVRPQTGSRRGRGAQAAHAGTGRGGTCRPRGGRTLPGEAATRRIGPPPATARRGCGPAGARSRRTSPGRPRRPPSPSAGTRWRGHVGAGNPPPAAAGRPASPAAQPRPLHRPRPRTRQRPQARGQAAGTHRPRRRPVCPGQRPPGPPTSTARRSR